MEQILMLLLMKKLNGEVNLPSKKKEIDPHYIQSYWKTSIIEDIQWFPFMTIMENTAYKIETQIRLLPFLLKVFAMFNMSLWYDNKNLEKNVVDNICIRCINCGETIGSSVKNTNYKDMVTKFVLNSVLHHVGLSWIIETNQQLEYYIYET